MVRRLVSPYRSVHSARDAWLGSMRAARRAGGNAVRRAEFGAGARGGHCRFASPGGVAGASGVFRE